MTLRRRGRSLLSRFALAIAFSTGLFAADFDWNLPKGFPRPAVPASNPMSAAKVELGRYLFYDKRMSVNGKESCGSCHRQELAFTDGRAHAEGTTGQAHPRSSMSLVNVAYAPSLTWANPTLDSLEEQALTPMLGEEPIELGLKGHEPEFLDALRRDPLYQRLFPAAFPGTDGVYTLANVTKAIAAFERTIVSMSSPYDRYRWGGDSVGDLGFGETRGASVLFQRARRMLSVPRRLEFQRHPIRRDAGPRRRRRSSRWLLQYGRIDVRRPNRGLYERTQRPEDIGKFRPPTLRNIALTAPYMHDGSLATLEEVLDHYAAGGKMDHPNKSRILKPFRLTEGEKHDLIEFLRSLTDEGLLHDPRWSDPWSSAEKAGRQK